MSDPGLLTRTRTTSHESVSHHVPSSAVPSSVLRRSASVAATALDVLTCITASLDAFACRQQMRIAPLRHSRIPTSLSRSRLQLPALATLHPRSAVSLTRARLPTSMSALATISRIVTHPFTTVSIHDSHTTVSYSTSQSAKTATSSAAASPYQWAVIGAGPAGIACVGQLLDHHIPPSAILWLDSAFAAGDFGTKWRNVSSNTTVGLFKRFYKQCKSFQYTGNDTHGERYTIEGRGDKETCALEIAAEPLRDVTARLRRVVTTVEGEVMKLEQHQQHFRIILSAPGNKTPTTSPSASASASSSSSAPLLAANVILATGAQPRDAPALHKSHPHISVIPLTTALDPQQLIQSIQPTDRVLIVGSSHTAVILIRTLLEQSSAEHVYNAYRDPLRYALYMDDLILFDDTGLKGDTARWSREHMHGVHNPKLTRLYSDDSNLNAVLPHVTKIIYATGFERRQLHDGIEDLGAQFSYNPHCGIIAPGLFGCGIAFPEQKTDKYGNVELRVGLWKFMVYIESVLPLWMKYSVLEGIGQPSGAPGTEKPRAML